MTIEYSEDWSGSNKVFSKSVGYSSVSFHEFLSNFPELVLRRARWNTIESLVSFDKTATMDGVCSGDNGD